MDSNRKLDIIKTYGFVDELRGLRMISFDLYRTNETKHVFMRCSDKNDDVVINKLYETLKNRLFITTCHIYNERL